MAQRKEYDDLTEEELVQLKADHEFLVEHENDTALKETTYLPMLDTSYPYRVKLMSEMTSYDAVEAFQYLLLNQSGVSKQGTSGISGVFTF